MEKIYFRRKDVCFYCIFKQNFLATTKQNSGGEQKNFGALPLNAPRGYTPGDCNSDIKEVRPKIQKDKIIRENFILQ